MTVVSKALDNKKGEGKPASINMEICVVARSWGQRSQKLCDLKLQVMLIPCLGVINNCNETTSGHIDMINSVDPMWPKPQLPSVSINREIQFTDL